MSISSVLFRPKEDEVQKAITDALTLARIPFYETTAFRQKGSTGVDKGVPDLLVPIPGHTGCYIGLEVKRPGAIRYTSPEQKQAHSYWRSNGDRMLSPDDFRGLSKKQVYRLFRAHNWLGIYDFDWHVEIASALDESGVLPTDFQLLPPQSNSPDVWTDIMRARTMNASQAMKGREKHICPFQLDVVDRLIERYSAKGETIFDPFAGIGTVPCRAVKAGRKAIGCELNGGYWADSITYLKAAENHKPTPTLFELDPTEDDELDGAA